LTFDSPNAAPELAGVVLAAKLGAIEGGVALLEQHLVEAMRVAVLLLFLLVLVAVLVLAGFQGRAADEPGQITIDETVKARVIGIGVEAELAAGALQPGLDGLRPFLVEEGVADLEGPGRFVHALGKQLGGRRSALDRLAIELEHDIIAEFVERAQTPAHRHEAALAREDDRRFRIVDIRPAGAVDGGAFDTNCRLQA
jgi:hypothetical protein